MQPAALRSRVSLLTGSGDDLDGTRPGRGGGENGGRLHWSTKSRWVVHAAVVMKDAEVSSYPAYAAVAVPVIAGNPTMT